MSKFIIKDKLILFLKSILVSTQSEIMNLKQKVTIMEKTTKYDVLNTILLNRFALTIMVLLILLALTTIPGMPDFTAPFVIPL